VQQADHKRQQSQDEPISKPSGSKLSLYDTNAVWLADITYVDADEGWLVLRKNRAGQICARSQRHFGDPEIQPKPAQTWSPKRCCLACDKQPTILIPKRPVVQAFLKS
jgi:hypothetical protein